MTISFSLPPPVARLLHLFRSHHCRPLGQSTHDRSRCHLQKIVITASRSTPLDLISTKFLGLPLSFPQSLTLSSSLSLVWPSLRVLMVLFWFFLSLKSLYIANFYYKICLEVEKNAKKMWETSRKFAFSKYYNTLENILWYNF